MGDKKPQTYSDLHLNDLKSLLDKNKYKEASELVEKVENELWFSNSSWDIIPLVCSYINNENVKIRPELVKCCQQILQKISNFCSPEETLFELLDKLECKDNDHLLLSLLEPVEVILNRLPARKSQSLEWCLSALKESLAAIDFENSIRVQLVFTKIETFYQKYCKKYATRNKPDEEFLSDAKNREEWEGARLSLSTFLLQCLALLSSSEHQVFTTNVVRCLADILPSLDVPLLFYLQQYTHRKSESHAWTTVPKSAFQMLYHEIFYHQTCIENFPAVYSHQFLINSFTLLSLELLKSKNITKQIRGLNLLENIIAQASPESLHYRSLALQSHRDTFKYLSKIMIYNETKEIREQTTKLLGKYILAFDAKGRFLFIHYASLDTDHEGLKGYLITQIKEISLQYWGADNYFMKNVAKLVCSVCKLEKGSDTLLFETADNVISALNLVRFLLLKDPKAQKPGSKLEDPPPGTHKSAGTAEKHSLNKQAPETVAKVNVTGIWDIEAYLKSKYLVEVAEALVKSKEYLRQQMCDAKSLELTDKKAQEKAANLCVTIGNQTIPFPKYDDEVRGIKAKLNTLDFIEFTLDMVNQLW